MNHNYLSIESIIPDFIAIYDYPDETTNFVSKVREIASHNPDHYTYISDFKAKCLEEIELNSSDEEKRYYNYMFTIVTDDLFEALYYDESKRPYYLYGLRCCLEELIECCDIKTCSALTKFHKKLTDLMLNHLKSLLKKESNFFKIGRCIITIINYIYNSGKFEIYNNLIELFDEFVDEESIDQKVFEEMMDNYRETYVRFISNFTNVWRTYRHRQEFIRFDLLNNCSETHFRCSLANNQDGVLGRLLYRDEMAFFLNNCLNYVSDNISSSGLPLLQFVLAKNLKQLDTSNVENYLINLEHMYFMDDNYQFIKTLPKENCIALTRDYYTKTLNFRLMSDESIDTVSVVNGFEFYIKPINRVVISINSYVLLNTLNEEGVNQQEKALITIKEYMRTDDRNEFFMFNDKIDFLHYIELLHKRCYKYSDPEDRSYGNRVDGEADRISDYIEDFTVERYDGLPVYTPDVVKEDKKDDYSKQVYDNFLIDVYTPIEPKKN